MSLILLGSTVWTKLKTLFTDDKKAGNAISSSLRIPIPPYRIGSEAFSHLESSNFVFVIDSNVCIIHRSISRSRDSEFQVGVVRKMYVNFGSEKQCISR